MKQASLRLNTDQAEMELEDPAADGVDGVLEDEGMKEEEPEASATFPPGYLEAIQAGIARHEQQPRPCSLPEALRKLADYLEASRK